LEDMHRLTADQAAKVHEALGPTRGYLDRRLQHKEHTRIWNGDPNLCRFARVADSHGGREFSQEKRRLVADLRPRSLPLRQAMRAGRSATT